MADDSQGAQAQMAFDPVTPIDTSSTPVEFLSQSMARQGTILDTDGIRGTRSMPQERSRLGAFDVGGTILLNPSPLLLDELLPRILGAAESTDTFALAETIPTFVIGVDTVADAFEYGGCYISKAIFRAQAQGLVELELDIIGKTIADLSFPALTYGVASNDAPYVISDSVVTLSAAARSAVSWEIEIDNLLQARFTNSRSADSITPQGRIITLRAQLPWSSAEANLYGDASHGTGATESTPITDGVLAITNGGMSTTFTFADFRVVAPTPSVQGKSSIPFNFFAQARMSGATRELVVTSDSVA